MIKVSDVYETLSTGHVAHAILKAPELLTTDTWESVALDMLQFDDSNADDLGTDVKTDDVCS